jgi:hypothetical protein
LGGKISETLGKISKNVSKIKILENIRKISDNNVCPQKNDIIVMSEIISQCWQHCSAQRADVGALSIGA